VIGDDQKGIDLGGRTMHDSKDGIIHEGISNNKTSKTITEKALNNEEQGTCRILQQEAILACIPGLRTFKHRVSPSL
jgi:hypothetical protein